MKKGVQTRQALLDCAMDYICQYGLLSMTIGEIAKRAGMSRTGIISHFSDKQDMQIAVMRHCEQVFVREVMAPSENSDALVHLRNLMQNWPNWVFRVRGKPMLSCPFVKAVAEYQEREPCAVRDVLVEQQQRTLAFIADLIAQAKAQKQLSDTTDPAQLAYVFYSLYLGHNISKYLLRDAQADQRFWQQVCYHLDQAKPKEINP